jgi:hypothetical protein
MAWRDDGLVVRDLDGETTSKVARSTITAEA